MLCLWKAGFYFGIQWRFNLEPEIKLHLGSSFKQLLPGIKTMHKMLQPLTVTLTPWLPAHIGPMDIVSVSVTSCIPPEMCVPPFTHARTHYGWQGKCGESHPVHHHCRASGRVDTNYSQPDGAKHCSSPPAAPPSGRRNPWHPFLSAWLCCVPFGHCCTTASRVLQMG